MSFKFQNYNERERHTLDLNNVTVTEAERGMLMAQLERLIANGRDISDETKAAMIVALLGKADAPDRYPIDPDSK